jgi:hypothetical protein
MLEDHGAWAVRFFAPVKDEDNEYERKFYPGYKGTGRAWLIPDYPHQDMLITFNAYPKNTFKLQRVARVLAYLLGEVDYRALTLLNNGSCEGVLYVNNSGTAYVVGNWPDKRRPRTEVDLDWSERVRMLCHGCHEEINGPNRNGEHLSWGGYTYCLDCHEELFAECDMCEDTCQRDALYDVIIGSGFAQVGSITLCRSCMGVLEVVLRCDWCGQSYWNDRLAHCPGCHRELEKETF